MKKKTCAILSLLMMLLFVSCSKNLTEKSDILKVFSDNEELFLNAAQTNDFPSLEEIGGVQQVLVLDSYVDIKCGGSGFGSSTHYYGIFYSETDDLAAVDVAGPLDELEADGNGYRYEQNDGDNEYYVEPLGNHYFYYEAHF